MEQQKLTISKKLSKISISTPNKIFINERFLGIMKNKSVSVLIPEGEYRIMIQSMIPFLYSTAEVHIDNGVENIIEFKDREMIWDLLFLVDIILWIAEFFFIIPEPWNLIYQIFTNGYFALWLGYEYYIRKKYYKIIQYKKQIK